MKVKKVTWFKGYTVTRIRVPLDDVTLVTITSSDMRRYSQRNSLSTLSEINITPLLDLAFVLLIIFMITTPLLENSVNLVIPSSGAANAPVNPAQVQTISIDRQEAIRSTISSWTPRR